MERRQENKQGNEANQQGSFSLLASFNAAAVASSFSFFF